jgi:hypothetical protein
LPSTDHIDRLGADVPPKDVEVVAVVEDVRVHVAGRPILETGRVVCGMKVYPYRRSEGSWNWTGRYSAIQPRLALGDS